MNELLLLTGIVIMLCILTDRFTDRLGIPSLLAFIALGMCFGVDGIFKIPFDDYEASEMICSVSLVFIMFYGGFGTNIKEAKPVIARGIVYRRRSSYCRAYGSFYSFRFRAFSAGKPFDRICHRLHGCSFGVRHPAF